MQELVALHFEDIEENVEYNKHIEYNLSYCNYRVDMDMNINDIQNFYINYISSLKDKNNFNKFINNLASIEVKKVSKLQTYFKSWNCVQDFIINDLMIDLNIA